MKVLHLIFGLAVLGANAPIAYAADDLAKIQSQIAQTEKKNAELSVRVASSERDIAKTKKDLVKAADQVSTLESRRSDIAKKIAELDAKIDSITRDIEQNRERISDSASSILFVAMNPNFDTDNMRDYVLMSSVLTGASDRFSDEIETANKQVKELEQVRGERAIEKEKLDRTAKKYTREKNELDKLLRTRSAQNEKLKSEQAGLQKKLRELSARAKSISELSAGVGSSAMSADASFSRRKLNLPVRGRVVVRYGEKTALGLKSDGWRIRTRGDALVMAPADGVVKFADNFRGFGKVIIMSHKNGYNTVLTNLGSVDVLPEQEVLAGEPIGRMSADKQEMYLEVRRGNASVDPARLFRDDEQ
jgi:septal ring factor EnvC (AmiA/AmiB activator)